MDFTPQITPEMKSRYIARRRDDLVKVESALASGDFQTLMKIAHQIKGNAATFHFEDLETAAIEMEKAAHAQDQAACGLTVTAFKKWLFAQSGAGARSFL